LLLKFLEQVLLRRAHRGPPEGSGASLEGQECLYSHVDVSFFGRPAQHLFEAKEPRILWIGRPPLHHRVSTHIFREPVVEEEHDRTLKDARDPMLWAPIACLSALADWPSLILP